MSEVVELTSVNELEDQRLLWSLLLAQTPGASFFQNLDWLICYWNHFGDGQRLRVLVVMRQGAPIGILPLIVRRESTRAGPMRVLTYPLHDWGSYYGPIGPHPSATLLAGLGYIRRTPTDWDLLDLRWVDFAGRDRGRTLNAMRTVGFASRGAVWKEPAMIDTTGTWEAYLASRPARFRRHIRRHLRRAERLGMDYVRHSPVGIMRGDADPRWDLFDACADIARRSWQGKSTNGTTLSHAGVRQFLRDAHVLAARSGDVDMNLLYCEDRPIGFLYNYGRDGYVNGLRAGYDPEFATLGVGTTLMATFLRELFQSDNHTLDLGVGSLDKKRPWLTHVARSHRFTHYSVATPRTQLLRWKRWLVEKGSGFNVHGSELNVLG